MWKVIRFIESSISVQIQEKWMIKIPYCIAGHCDPRYAVIMATHLSRGTLLTVLGWMKPFLSMKLVSLARVHAYIWNTLGASLGTIVS